MPRNRNDRIERGVDNPRIKPEPQVQGPRQFAGSDFRDFPRLVVQLGRPRPQRPARAPEAPAPPPGAPSAASAEPKEGFARPLRGMGMGQYEGFRESAQPAISAYRTSVHDAYADGTITPEEQKALRQQRRGLRQDAQQYRNQHPLQMGLGSRVKELAQGDRTGGIGETVKSMAHSPDVVQGQQWPKSTTAPNTQHLSLENLRQLQEAWKSGTMTPEQVLEALGFTGRLPNG